MRKGWLFVKETHRGQSACQLTAALWVRHAKMKVPEARVQLEVVIVLLISGKFALQTMRSKLHRGDAKNYEYPHKAFKSGNSSCLAAYSERDLTPNRKTK